MKELIFIFFTLTTLTNVSYASFPVFEAEKAQVTIGHSVNQNPWYISVKNSLLFLATSFVGLSFFVILLL